MPYLDGHDPILENTVRFYSCTSHKSLYSGRLIQYPRRLVLRNVAWGILSVSPKVSSPSSSVPTDFIPRVSKRTGNSVNISGPNKQPTSSDRPEISFENL